MNRCFSEALEAITDELVAGLTGDPGPMLEFNDNAFALFCRFGHWCLTDPENGVLRHVTRCAELRTEIEQVAALCAQSNTDRAAWQAHLDPIMRIAMGDAGGNEARAADVAYGIARVVAEQNSRFAGTAIRKMMRLTSADVLNAKLLEMAQTPA